MGRPRKTPPAAPPLMDDPFICSSAPPAAEPEPKCCLTCRFYNLRSYTCHRYPPLTTIVYPVKPEMWCGEYRAK